MKSFNYTIIILTLFSCLWLNKAKTQPMNMQDSLALVDLYNSSGGIAWTNADQWLSNEPASTWFGIGVNDVSGEARVTTIELPINNLQGSIPSTINNLEMLQVINLKDNNLENFPLLNTSFLISLTDVIVSENRLTFEDIAPNIFNAEITNFLYFPQQDLGPLHQLAKVGEAFELNMGVDEGLGVVFQWFFDGAPLGPPSPSPGFLINPIAFEDGGQYEVNLSQPNIPDLEIKGFLDLDLLCRTSTEDCVVCNEIVISLDDPADRLVVDTFLANRGLMPVDSCMCMDTLVLYKADEFNIDIEKIKDDMETMVEVEGDVDFNFEILVGPVLNTNLEGEIVDIGDQPDLPVCEDSVLVAIVDSGVERAHPQLQNFLWSNPDEFSDGSDNDMNCLPDDIEGYDFLNDLGAPAPFDNDGHGTHLAGIITSSPPINTDLSFMDQKFYQKGNASLFAAVCAMHHAMDKGAQVINLSWGFEGDSSAAILEKALYRAKDLNVVIVASAGNKQSDNDGKPHWPSNHTTQFDNMLSVAAVSQFGPMSFGFADQYSNFGFNTVDLAAIGTKIRSTFPTHTLEVLSGTSMAAAFVSRAAAHLWACNKGATAVAIVDCIEDNVIDNPAIVTGLAGKVRLEGMLNYPATMGCVINSTLEIPEPEQIHIYPQPFQDYFIMDLSGLTFSNAIINLYNSTGQLLLSREVQAGSTVELRGLNRTYGFLPGIYFYTMKTENTIYTGKLIKGRE